MDGNEWQECNVTGNNRSIPARGFYVTSTERTLCKSHRWSLGLFSFPSADPEGRFPANKRMHERGSCLGGRLHEFFLVLWIGTQFRTDGSPNGVQPSLQNCFANSRCGLNEARKWKIWQSGSGLPACDTKIEHLTGDSQMDIKDDCRALLEKIMEHTFDKVQWIN